MKLEDLFKQLQRNPVMAGVMLTACIEYNKSLVANKEKVIKDFEGTLIDGHTWLAASASLVDWVNEIAPK